MPYNPVKTFSSYKLARQAAQALNVPFSRVGRLYIVQASGRRTHNNIFTPTGRILVQTQLAEGKITLIKTRLAKGKTLKRGRPAYQW